MAVTASDDLNDVENKDKQSDDVYSTDDISPTIVPQPQTQI